VVKSAVPINTEWDLANRHLEGLMFTHPTQQTPMGKKLSGGATTDSLFPVNQINELIQPFENNRLLLLLEQLFYQRAGPDIIISSTAKVEKWSNNNDAKESARSYVRGL